VEDIIENEKTKNSQSYDDFKSIFLDEIKNPDIYIDEET
jgi:hypothetical protein